MNSLYLRRRLKVVVPPCSAGVDMRTIAALQKNLENLGFILAPEVCEQVRKLTPEKLEAFYKGVVSAVREMVGAHRDFRPMYPNFPAQVMEMDEARLYWNAILHYCTNRLQPFEKRERTPLLEAVSPKVIGLGSREDFERIFTLLAASSSSLSVADKADLRWFVSQYRDDIARLLPAKIPSRENLAVLGAALLRQTTFGTAWVAERVKTATDVLRIAVAMSNGDVSLAASTKFGKFSRRERRLLLSWLERSANATEDMLRWKPRWIRLGERLHPGELRKTFPKTAAAFDVLRKDQPFETFNSAIERHLAAADAPAAVALLKTRPGEMARRLDHLLRKTQAPDAVLTAFAGIAASVSTPVLLQVLTHFRCRAVPSDLRIFFPKGDVGKVQAILNELPALPADTAEAAAAICEKSLLDRFAKLPPLGRCFLDAGLRDYVVPFSQRSAAKALRTLVRGSRLPLPECNVLRLFIWWRNGRSRTDIDLSAAFYDADFKYLDVVSYYNLKNYGGCHSGDIVDAPEGAAEFIDIDLARTRAGGVRYVVMSIFSYTNQPYCDLPECFAGWMARQQAGSGEIFEPRTVQDKVDVASDTKVCLPAIFDLVENQVIWADIALEKSPYWNNLQNNLSGVSLMLRAILGLRKTSLHELFELHIRVRGSLVDAPEAAEQIFSVNQGITPFDLDRIAADFL